MDETTESKEKTDKYVILVPYRDGSNSDETPQFPVKWAEYFGEGGKTLRFFTALETYRFARENDITECLVVKFHGRQTLETKVTAQQELF